MKKKHYLLFEFVSVCLILSLTVCSGGKKNQGAPAKKDKYVVGFSQIGSESLWRIANTNEMQEAYSRHPRFTMIYSDAEQKRENQIAAMRSFIQQKVDAIIFVPIVATGWEAILIEAKDAGIPVIIINRIAKMVSGNIEDYTLCLVSPDNVYAGEVLAQTFAESFGEEPGPIYVAELTGTVGSSSTVDRGKGIHNFLDKQNKIVIKYTQTGDFTSSTAKHVMESIIKTARAEKVNLRGIISHNDDMAIGASQAIAEAGLTPGKDIKIAGIDGIKSAFEAIVEGHYTVTVENPLGYGDKTIEILLDYLDNGKSPDKYWVILKNAVYTEKNASVALPNRKY